MVPFKREKGIVAATLAIFSTSVLAPSVSARDQVGDAPAARFSEAHTRCTSKSGSGHCYAIAETTGFIADGAAARFDVREYTAPDWDHALPSDGFTAQVLWVGVENSPVADDLQAFPPIYSEWCEIGWTKSFQNSGAYSHYWAYVINGVYDEFAIYYGIELGRSYHYQILREYDGKYNLYIDLQDVGDCWANPFSLWLQVGLEYTHPGALAAVNDPRELQWRAGTDFTWYSWGDLDTPVNTYERGDAARWSWEVHPTHGENWTTN